MASYVKVYVSVYLKTDTDGKSAPVALEWTDGTTFNISKILDDRFAPPDWTGGILTRKFRVLIRGRQKNIYYETLSNKWFVEKLV